MRSPFDTFAKVVAQRGLAPACFSASEHEIRHDPQRADLLIEPDPRRLSLLEPLGLFGRCCHEAAILEFFHGTPSPRTLEACLFKLLALRRRRRREGKRAPCQWIFVSGEPKSALRLFGFRRDRSFGRGVYRAPDGFATGLVVARRLPVTRDTLLIRLMAGKGPVLARARDEVLALPKDAIERQLARRVMVQLWPTLGRDRQRAEFRVMMQPMVDEWEEELNRRHEDGLAKGRAKGLRQGAAESLLSVYEARFGAVPQAISKAVRAARSPDVLQGWVRLVATGAEEAIAAAIVPARRRPAARGARAFGHGAARAAR